MSNNELKLVVGGVSAALLNALSRTAATLLTLGQIVGTALRKLLKK